MENDQRMSDSAPSSLADAIAREIEQSVTSGEMQPHEFIGTKDDLQSRFSVARGTLNEAIRLLRSRSVIKVRPGVGGGIFVAESSSVMRFGNFMLRLHGTSAFAEECMKVREALDPAIAADAARYRTDADIADLNQLIDEMARTPNEAVLLVRVNWKLHRRIASITANELLRNLYLCLVDVFLDDLAGVTGEYTDAGQRLEVHMNLVRAIAAGDPVAASYWGGERHRFPFGKNGQNQRSSD
jgi:DNA-binding FadR family transcriptional regulator